MTATVPAPDECQPVFRAYCAAHGLTAGDHWQTHEFIIWSHGQHTAFLTERGLRWGAMWDVDEYLRWLDAKVSVPRKQLTLFES